MKIGDVDLDPSEFRKRAGVQPQHVTVARVQHQLAEAKNALVDYATRVQTSEEEDKDIEEASLLLTKLLEHLNGRLEQQRLEQEGALAEHGLVKKFSVLVSGE